MNLKLDVNVGDWIFIYDAVKNASSEQQIIYIKIDTEGAKLYNAQDEVICYHDDVDFTVPNDRGILFFSSAQKRDECKSLNFNPDNNRQRKFLKIYPNARLENGVIDICPLTVDTNYAKSCNKSGCGRCRCTYWLSSEDSNQCNTSRKTAMEKLRDTSDILFRSYNNSEELFQDIGMMYGGQTIIFENTEYIIQEIGDNDSFICLLNAADLETEVLIRRRREW